MLQCIWQTHLLLPEATPRGPWGDRASSVCRLGESDPTTNFVQTSYKLRAYMKIPPTVEETPASRLAAPRDHAPLGHVAVLRLQIMTLIEVVKKRFPIRDFNDNFYTHAL